MNTPELFNESMLEHLRKNYALIERVNPEGPTYPKICKLLDSLDDARLKQLSLAGIKWISTLAANRRIARQLQKPSVAAVLLGKTLTRMQRFQPGDRVIVRNTGRAYFEKLGQVDVVLLSGEVDVQDFQGRAEGPFHAKYRVDFLIGSEEFYDWELEPSK